LSARERSLEAKLTTVRRFAFEVASEVLTPGVRRVAVRHAAELCQADGATLFLLDSQTLELTFDVVDGAHGDALVERRLAPGQGLAGRVAHMRLPLLVADTRVSEAFAPEFDQATGFTTRSVIAVPVVFGDRLLGVLECVRGPAAPPFVTEDLVDLQLLAPHVGVGLAHADNLRALSAANEQLRRGHQELEQKVEERTALIAAGKKQWEATFDAIHDPIVIIEGTTVRRANSAYLSSTGRTWAELIGRPCHEVFAGRDTPCPGCPMLAQKQGAQEVAVGPSVFQVSSYPLAADAGPPMSVVHYRDLTEQKRLSTWVRENERLVAIGQLASGAAHEINNPLSYVVTNLSMLKEVLSAGVPSRSQLADTVDAIDESLDGAKRISAVVKGLGELSKQEQVTTEPVQVNAAVQRAIREELGAARPASVSLESTALVSISALQLEQAVTQVLRNARQASADPGTIELRTWDTSDFVCIEVRDRGHGIPEQHLGHVFEPFFTTRKIGEGTGLGLTAAWGITRRHGGELRLESKVGEGTTVTFTFPRRPVAEVRAPPTRGRYVGPAPGTRA